MLSCRFSRNERRYSIHSSSSESPGTSIKHFDFFQCSVLSGCFPLCFALLCYSISSLLCTPSSFYLSFSFSFSLIFFRSIILAQPHCDPSIHLSAFSTGFGADLVFSSSPFASFSLELQGRQRSSSSGDA